MELKTKLDELYSLREDFSVIGITGRTGSGCSNVAEILKNEFHILPELTKPKTSPLTIQERKYEIVYNFNEINWKQYKIIEYKHVLFLLLLKSLDKEKLKELLKLFFKKDKNSQSDTRKVESCYEELYKVFKEHENTVQAVKNLKEIKSLSEAHELRELGTVYWTSDFIPFVKRVDETLKEYGKLERIFLLQNIAINFRSIGVPLPSESSKSSYENIYNIAKSINRIIKATRILNSGNCHVVIDSLRNSSEINFFRERYSGFYLVAVKAEDRRHRLLKEYENDIVVVDKLLEIDEIEYKSSGFVKGDFFKPDVQNCIQKADFHIISREGCNQRDFISVSQQLIKLQGLIQQPGLITPSSVERCMQFAFNAKLSSGCISRQVGAVITDNDFSIKSVGWNDVPKGAVPCSARNVKELSSNSAFGFSDFEKGIAQSNNNRGESTTGNEEDEIDSESVEFNNFVKESYNDENINKNDLAGLNCSYCFKTAYNKFKGDSNQVHTRSLHAEENAMLQISKYGGQPLNNGILFTTASPCELCSKKAYQLGIKDVYYIDPYPGISRTHTLKQSYKNKEESSDPRLIMYSGAIGRGYVKLYEPFMAQKDEISILTGHDIKTPEAVQVKQFKDFLKDKVKHDDVLSSKLDDLYKEGDLSVDSIIQAIKKGLNKKNDK